MCVRARIKSEMMLKKQKETEIKKRYTHTHSDVYNIKQAKQFAHSIKRTKVLSREKKIYCNFGWRKKSAVERKSAHVVHRNNEN